MARVYGGFIDEMQAAGKILRRVDVSVPQSESNSMQTRSGGIPHTLNAWIVFRPKFYHV
jgi:hypothetical protein